MRRVGGFGIACLVCALAACQWKGGPRPTTRPATQPSGVWRAEPVAMRVYPSSRFATDDDGAALLEARIELLDEMGHSVKGAGVFHVELWSEGKALASGGERLYAWDVPLLTLADQRRHYDPVTRAYLFRLSLDEAGVPRRPTVLRVLFTPVDRLRLEASAALPPAEE